MTEEINKLIIIKKKILRTNFSLFQANIKFKFLMNNIKWQLPINIKTFFQQQPKFSHYVVNNIYLFAYQAFAYA